MPPQHTPGGVKADVSSQICSVETDRNAGTSSLRTEAIYVSSVDQPEHPQRFVSHDPQACALFLDAIERTLKDRRTGDDERRILQDLQKVLPSLRVTSGRRSGRSIIYGFEGQEQSKTFTTLDLVSPPNFKRRMLLIEVDSENRPLSVECTP